MESAGEDKNDLPNHPDLVWSLKPVCPLLLRSHFDSLEEALMAAILL